MASQPIISSSVPDEVVLQLDLIAKDRDTSRSVVVCQLLQYALNEYNKVHNRFKEVSQT